MSRSRLNVAVLLCGLLAAVSTEAEIPDRLESVGTNRPHQPLAWLSEEALNLAMDAEDQPEGSRLQSVAHLFRLGEDDRLEWSLDPEDFEIAPDGTLICEPKPLTHYWGEQATDIQALVELAKTIVSVRVLDSKPGFFASSYAGELLEVEVLEVLKYTEPGNLDAWGEMPAAPPDDFYLFDRYARMVIDGRAICLGTRQVPRGEFFLFMLTTRQHPFTPLPLYALDTSALIAADGSFYGYLLDRSKADSQEELARQLAGLEQILRRQR
ncbi:MAG: hypothetical protein GY719_18700 [bacterium]|nr:hypothetical protein [bacterium]